MEQTAALDGQRAVVRVCADLLADPVARHHPALHTDRGQAFAGVLELA
jgi:hypothetical protein